MRSPIVVVLNGITPCTRHSAGRQHAVTKPQQISERSLRQMLMLLSGLENLSLKKIGFRFIGFQVFFSFFGFNLQMPDRKLRPTSTMKIKDKSSEQKFGHVNATNRNSYLNIIFIELVMATQ